jgi:hypothetical protein
MGSRGAGAASPGDGHCLAEVSILCVVFTIGCGEPKTDDGGAATTGDVTSATSGEQGLEWPEACVSSSTQEECESIAPQGARRCIWVAQRLLTRGELECAVDSSIETCLAFEIQGTGCGYVPGEYDSCAVEAVPEWFREEAGAIWFIEDLCEPQPIGWTRCFATVPGDEPAACECACLG